MEEEKLPEKPKDIKFNFIESECDYFIEKCLLSEIQGKILKLKSKDYSDIYVSSILHISQPTLTREKNKIKRKIFRAL